VFLKAGAARRDIPYDTGFFLPCPRGHLHHPVAPAHVPLGSGVRMGECLKTGQGTILKWRRGIFYFDVIYTYDFYSTPISGVS